MTPLRKILGTSILSLSLVIWGLFMVCSGRVPDLGIEDDWMTSEEGYEYENEETENTTQVTTLDAEATQLEEAQRREILEALGIDPEQILIVSDSDVNLRAGRAMGMASAGVLSGLGDERDMRDADIVLPSVTELPEWL